MKYNIAICGTFNVENYGDVMFPVIFEKAMRERNLDFDLYLFSPGERDVETLAPGAVVYPVRELNLIHKKNPLDAIVIGGGALIHYSKIPVKMANSQEFIDYNIYDSWYTPIEFAVRNNIKVIFNLPQVPYDFDEAVKQVTKEAFKAAEYISVRDCKSKEFINAAFDNENPIVTVCPDSVCCMPQLISSEYLADIRKNILPFEQKYAVIQFNPQKPDSENEDMLKIIKRLSSENMKVVLLPLGYTHNDDAVLNTYNSENGNLCFTFEKKLNIFEMAAVLAGCDIYIGASFHGAITAIAYGNVAFSYNYIIPRTKNREIFEMYNVSDFVAETADELLNKLDNYLMDKMPFSPDKEKVEAEVNRHFDRILNLILSDNSKKINYGEFIYPLIDLLPKIISDSNSLTLLAEQTKATNVHVSNLESSLSDKEKEISELVASYSELNKNYAELNSHYLAAINNFNQIQNSFFWRLTSPARKISQGIKNYLSRHRKMLVLAIFAKGFLRGGIKGGISRVNQFRGVNLIKDKLTLKLSKKIRCEQEKYEFSKNIKFSILVPLYNTPLDFLEQMIKSVQLQTYGNWELCLADGSDEEHQEVGKYCLQKSRIDKRIKYKKLTENKGISENTNACIHMATGDYIALFDHDDVLDLTVLFEYMKVICEQDADFIYCDEDKFSEFGGKLYDANYKPDFAVDNLRSNNYICHFTVFKKSLLESSGIFRKEFDGSQDHDMILRLTEQAKHIVHIPKVLYHWRVSAASVASDPYAKPYTIKAGRKAVAEHLERVGLSGKVESTVIHPNIYRIKYDIIGEPLVSIIIPNYNHIDELSRCIDSIFEKSTYKNYEIIIVENNSNEEAFEYYDTLKKYDNVKVVVYKPEKGFNYSAINNFGVQFAKGEHYILLNNDVEIISPDWIQEMLMYSQRPDVGAVGAMLYYPNDTIQHAGVTIGVLTLAGHNFKHSQRGNPGYFGRAGYQQNISAVTAACLMIKASIYTEINGLDESFEVAFNDIDFCMRIRKAGYVNIFTPFAELYHYESISRGDDVSPEKRKRFVSEVERFQKRWKLELEQGDPYYNPNLTLDKEDFSYKI